MSKSVTLSGRKRLADIAQEGARQLTQKKNQLLNMKLAEFNEAATQAGELLEIDLGMIKPDPSQPRKTFGDLTGLTQSIKANGIIQPLIVSPINDKGKHTIIAGERRWRAAKAAKLRQVPCIVRPQIDANVLILQLLENDQRENVSPLEEAEAVSTLINALKLPKAQVASELGRDSAWVSMRLGLIKASDDIKQLAEKGLIEDVRTLHELRMFSDKHPRAAANLIEQIKSNKVSGPYRQIIAQARARVGQGKTAQKTKRIKSMQYDNGALILDCGTQRPQTFRLSEKVLLEFLTTLQ